MYTPPIRVAIISFCFPPTWHHHSCTTRLAESDSVRIGLASRASIQGARGESVHPDSAAMCIFTPWKPQYPTLNPEKP